MFWEQYFYVILSPDFTIIISKVDCWILLESIKALEYSKIQK